MPVRPAHARQGAGGHAGEPHACTPRRRWPCRGRAPGAGLRRRLLGPCTATCSTRARRPAPPGREQGQALARVPRRAAAGSRGSGGPTARPLGREAGGGPLRLGEREEGGTRGRGRRPRREVAPPSSPRCGRPPCRGRSWSSSRHATPARGECERRAGRRVRCRAAELDEGEGRRREEGRKEGAQPCGEEEGGGAGRGWGKKLGEWVVGIE
ncbi:hypothetical protein PVAP13_4NG031750 [Panicum virgatum]|uniref:Uncharacterized protein n=1 Tax=Panicum virgatum TaxID=38727 RepID=A0A8T0T114_PANVG|nr:hypothetical protein PVAP13_4NG031750 [Panicum virgatum]